MVTFIEVLIMLVVEELVQVVHSPKMEDKVVETALLGEVEQVVVEQLLLEEAHLLALQVQQLFHQVEQVLQQIFQALL